MKTRLINCSSKTFIGLALAAGLVACSQLPSSQTLSIQGSAFESTPLGDAQITLVDAKGQQWQAQTNERGEYQLTATGLKAPLLISVVKGGKAQDCVRQDVHRPICLAATVAELPSGKNLHLNLNPLTDRVASDVAVQLGFTGPQQLVDAQAAKKISAAMVNTAQQNMRSGFEQALTLVGVKAPQNFDPATAEIHAGTGVSQIFALLHHNRNYDNLTGQAGVTTLTDIAFRPVVGLNNQGAYEPFDLPRARLDMAKIKAAKTRVFFVGDSTSAVYEQYRMPRMGWGQVFQNQFKNNQVIVVDGSRSGRSSRDFYNGRWFDQMASLIQAGDYVFINHGHNDQNCDAAKPARGGFDVGNLCTYPNDVQGNKQFPAGKPEMSFQNSLERYVQIARSKGAIPIMFTPTTRIKNAKGEMAAPVVHSHYIKASKDKDYAFVGDYSQTIMDTAKANNLPLIDLEKATIAFANFIGEPGWRDYWMVVDPQKYPYYANNMGGSIQNPDGTHLQQRGAEAIARMVAEEIRRNPELTELAKQLKPVRQKVAN